MRSRRPLQAGLALLVLLLTAGCFGETLEQLSIIYGIAYELDPDNKELLTATASIPQYVKGGFENRLVTAQGKSSMDIRNAMSLQTSGRLVDEKMLVLLIDHQLARQSTYRLLGPYMSELKLPARSLIAVTETSPKELLGINMQKMDPATGMNAIVAKHERLGLMPKSNLLTFVKQQVREGQDPYLPLIAKEEDGQGIRIVGLALFKDDRYVMPLKGAGNLLLFALLHQSVTNGTYELGGGKQSLRMRIERSGVSYDWRPSEKKMDVRVRVHASLLERTTSPTEVFSEAVTIELKRKAERELADRLGMLIRKLQRSGLDPVGFGEIARSQDSHWKGSEWNSIYQQTKFNIVVKINFDRERR
ncbi:Ger(x)C family spore germination protein [Paenibacillus silvisoli]|uniref:Ger(x)C family spore germination protein n=1 Tax=Paenibacillus silvisoli TaxID=3110539 RepID=UPI002B1BE346|nr:Ger(x)C family spore germination protein [Paenibacillus silvisoli]